MWFPKWTAAAFVVPWSSGKSHCGRSGSWQRLSFRPRVGRPLAVGKGTGSGLWELYWEGEIWRAGARGGGGGGWGDGSGENVNSQRLVGPEVVLLLPSSTVILNCSFLSF